jgi:hypothetical protein
MEEKFWSFADKEYIAGFVAHPTKRNGARRPKRHITVNDFITTLSLKKFCSETNRVLEQAYIIAIFFIIVNIFLPFCEIFPIIRFYGI